MKSNLIKTVSNRRMNVAAVLVTALLVVISAKSNSQSVVMNADVNPGGVINELPLAPPRTTGSYYLEKEWLLGDFELINGVVINKYPIKYDLWNNVLEIDINGSTRVCQMNRLKSYTWKKFGESKSSKFINSTYISTKAKNNPKTILLVLAEDSELGIYKRYYLDVKEADYALEFDMGNKDNQLLKKEAYYVFSNNVFYRLKSSLKKNKDFFGDNYEMVSAHSKDNGLKFKREQDLLAILKYYKSL